MKSRGNFSKPFIRLNLFRFAKFRTSGKHAENHQISMIEHISLSFPPYCGIFNSTKREPFRSWDISARSLADTSCVTGLPARSKHRSCRIFLPSPRTHQNSNTSDCVAFSDLPLPSPKRQLRLSIPLLRKAEIELKRRGGYFSVKSQTIATRIKTKR